MKCVYLKHKLSNLPQGESIAFVREFKRFTKDVVAERSGLTGESKRRTIARHESKEKTQKKYLN